MKKIIFILLFPLSVYCQTNVKFSDLPVANPLGGSEVIPVVQDGINRQSTPTAIRTFVGATSNLYGGTSPTTIGVGGLPLGSSLVGKTYDQILQSILVPYISPSFNSFSVAYTTPVEVGTTISGGKSFTWNISANSGTVPTIDILDITGSYTLLSGTANDGSQTVTVTTRQLNSNGATQVWSGRGNNTSPSGTFSSTAYTVTSRFYYFYGARSTSVITSSQVRGLANSAFRISGTTFPFNTGTSLTKFIIALPPSVTITSVTDATALGADITSQYVLTGTINVLDAGGTNRAYNIYEMNISVPYSINHSHQVTIN